MVPTVKVKSQNHEQGFYLINQEDFDESKHEVHVELTAEQVQAAKDAEEKAVADKLAAETTKAPKGKK